GRPAAVSSQALSGDPADSVAVRIISPEATTGGDFDVISLAGVRGRRSVEWLELGLRAGLAVPILAGSTVVGVLEFFSADPVVRDPELLDLLLTVGTQVGRVVERQRSEEARLRALIDNMPAQVYLRDLNGRFILANQQYEEFWGLPHDFVRGKTLFDTDSRTPL